MKPNDVCIWVHPTFGTVTLIREFRPYAQRINEWVVCTPEGVLYIVPEQQLIQITCT